MTITALPTPPSPSDSPATFNSKAFDLLGALPTFVTEANGLEAENAAAASASATAAANAVLATRVTGPASATDNTLPRFDGTTGKLLQGSGVVVDDSSNMGVGGIPYQKFQVYGNMRLDNGASAALLQSVETGVAYRDLHIDAAGTYHINGAFGYGAGAGGSVTQATSKTTGVTLNKPSGLITMHNAALAANTSVEFVLTNSFISATDVVVLNLKNASIGFKYRAQVWEVVNGGVYIQLTNITGGSLSEAVPINFAVIKGSTT